jgi:hypothetical protein
MHAERDTVPEACSVPYVASGKRSLLVRSTLGNAGRALDRCRLPGGGESQRGTGSHDEPPAFSSVQVIALVDRTYHDANHNVLLAGAPLPVSLRRSRAIKDPR